jgi:hypothetical protein
VAAGRLANGDLLAGSVAATLLLIVVALGVTPWLAVPLALTTYAGVATLSSRSASRDAAAESIRRQHLAYQAAIANAAAIQALAPQIAKPAVRTQIDRILDRITRVLLVIRDDNSLAAAPVFNERLMEPFHSLLANYVRLSSRGITSAGGLLEKTETHDLDLIEQALNGFYEQLHRGQVIDLATLSEMVELNLERFGTMTPRRDTP